MRPSILAILTILSSRIGAVLGAEPIPSAPAEQFAPLESSDIRGDDQFYFFLFTSQSNPKVPRSTHTWAAMVQVRDGVILQAPSISWMPTDLRVKPWYWFVEQGTNFSYFTTLQWITSQSKQHISLRGPFPAHPELYVRFLRQKAVLESGAVGYQCLDFVGQAAAERNGVNCIHALIPLHGLAPGDVLQLYGDDSGIYIENTLRRRGLIGPASMANEWLTSALGLSNFPIRRASAPAMAATQSVGAY